MVGFVENGKEEFEFAKQALFGEKSKNDTLLGSSYYFANMVPFDVLLLDEDTYPKCVPLELYYNITSDFT